MSLLKMPDNFGGGARPEGNSNTENSDSQESSNDRIQRPSAGFPDREQSQSGAQGIPDTSSIVMICISILALSFGIIFALKFKRRK